MEPELSFSQKIKIELSSRPYRDEELRAALSAFVKINGTLSIRDRKASLFLKTENPAVARFLHQAIERIYGLPSRFVYTRERAFHKRTLFHVIIEEGADDLLADLEIPILEGKINKSLVSGDELIGGYLAGAFLASGSVNSPKSSNYHLEIALNDESHAKWFLKLIHRYRARSFDAKSTTRRKRFVVYLKKSDQIADFLIAMGATECALEFEDVRVDRDFSNIENRLQNLDLANYMKSSAAARRELEDIAVLERFLGSERLESEKERLLYSLRKDNPDASLRELASLLSERLGVTVSRSNVSHLFHALHLKAERYRKAL